MDERILIIVSWSGIFNGAREPETIESLGAYEGILGRQLSAKS